MFLFTYIFQKTHKNHEDSGNGGIISRQRALSLIGLNQQGSSTFVTAVQGSHKLIKVKAKLHGRRGFLFLPLGFGPPETFHQAV